METVETLITENLDVWTPVVKTKSSAGRGSSRKRELYGIKKLRELILELAVMGKLVPQDPKDEPAGDTLVKIESRNEELRVSKGIRATKPFAPVAGAEIRLPIPSNWKWVRPDHLCYQITDGAHHTPEYVEAGIPFLSVKDMSKGHLDFSSTRYVSPSQHDELIKRCNPEEGDLLLTKIGTTGIPLVINTKKEFSIFVSVALLKFPQELLLSSYFKTVFESPLVKKQSDEFTMGVGNKNLVLKHIRNFALPLPPLAEQHRIVAKVDELMALCDQLEQEQTRSLETHDTLVATLLGALTTATADASQFAEAWQRIQANFDTLFTTESSIDQLKQTILQLAVMGKLVEQDPEEEPASELLKKIAAEKANLIKEKRIKKQKAASKVPTKEKYFKIQDNWTWSRLGEISLTNDSGWSPQCEPQQRDKEDQWGVLKVSAVSWGKFQPHEHKTLPANLEPRIECEVKAGDFLLSRANTEELVARSIIVEETPPKLMMSDKIVRFEISSEVSKAYVNLVNTIRPSRDFYMRNASGTSASMKNISRATMTNLPIPLPPLAEQHRIVAKVDELMNLCDALKTQLKSAQSSKLTLADTLVEQAIN